jgi:hypothetical protein
VALPVYLVTQVQLVTATSAPALRLQSIGPNPPQSSERAPIPDPGKLSVLLTHSVSALTALSSVWYTKRRSPLLLAYPIGTSIQQSPAVSACTSPPPLLPFLSQTFTRPPCVFVCPLTL